MTHRNPYRAPIPPVQEGIVRPLWSVMIPTYHCARFLQETLKSVLAQDPGSELMQIEVIDDHSTEDDPAAVVEEVGCGRVRFFRQPENMGHVRNFNTCLQRSHGKLVHILHGDDCVREGFYSKMQQAFEGHSEIGAAFCRYISMDESGHWQTISPLEQPRSGIIDGWLEKIAAGQRLQPPAMVVRREVYERLGGYDRRISRYGEDWEMWVRIAADSPVWYETEPLALYRVHAASLSGQTARTGENGRDLRKVMAINKAYLPESRAAAITGKARKNFALACLRRAHRMLGEGRSEAAFAQMREGIKTSRSFGVLVRASFVFVRWMWQKIPAQTILK